MTTRLLIHSCFDPQTYTVTHVVADQDRKHAVIIDSVLDYDLVTRALSHERADRIIDLVRKRGYSIQSV